MELRIPAGRFDPNPPAPQWIDKISSIDWEGPRVVGPRGQTVQGKNVLDRVRLDAFGQAHRLAQIKPGYVTGAQNHTQKSDATRYTWSETFHRNSPTWQGGVDIAVLEVSVLEPRAEAPQYKSDLRIDMYKVNNIFQPPNATVRLDIDPLLVDGAGWKRFEMMYSNWLRKEMGLPAFPA